MAISKSSSAVSLVAASTNNTAGGTTPGSALETKYAGSIAYKMTNGGTAPTLACGLWIEYSADGTNWFSGGMVAIGDTVASSVTKGTYVPDVAWRYCRPVFAGNTGQTVVVQADGSVMDGI